MLVELSDEEYNVVIEALLLYSRTHRKEYTQPNPSFNSTEFSRVEWVKSYKLIEKLEMADAEVV